MLALLPASGSSHTTFRNSLFVLGGMSNGECELLKMSSVQQDSADIALRQSSKHHQPDLMQTFYCFTVESVLAYRIRVWNANCTVKGQKITTSLPTLEDIDKQDKLLGSEHGKEKPP